MKKASFDRRSFIKGAAVLGSAAVAGSMIGCSPSSESSEKTDAGSSSAGSGQVFDSENYQSIQWKFMVPPEPVSDDDISETYTADIIVVGSGPSGLCTAVACQEAGGDVILFSASSGPVGRGGSNFGFDTDYQRSQGIEWTQKSARTTVRVREYYTSNGANWKLWSKWMQNSRDTMNWMIEHMESQGLKVQLENGYDDPDGLLSSEAYSHCFYTDEEPQGMNTGAPLQAQAWANIFTENGGQIYYDTVAKCLIRDDDNTGRVSAVVAQTADESYVKFVANKAVVLATGDFAKDPDMMACFAPDIFEAYKETLTETPLDYNAQKIFSGTMPGDGHKMGLWIGAGWQKSPVGPMLMGMLGGPVDGYGNFYGINLDKTGHRFHNEVVLDGIAAKSFLRCPDGIAYGIWDSDYYYSRDTWHSFGCTTDGSSGISPMTPDEMKATWEANAENGTCFKADTLEELIDMLDGLDKENALASIGRYNQFCENGEDLDYEVNPECLVPIKNPPFYGVKSNGGGFLCMCGGLRTNENLQVCDSDDNPIEGLYNIGVMTGDFFPNGYTYVLIGASMGGTCCTLAYLLGQDLAKL